MSMLIILVAAAVVTAVAGTVVQLTRDGYRRTPTRAI